MNFIEDNLYHIYNQGNNKQKIFLSNEDYLVFLRLTRKYILPNSEIVAYCLMPNHFHFLVYADERVNTTIKQGGIVIDPLTNGVRKLLSGYARIFNKQNNSSGSLFRQKTKHKCLTEWDVETSSTFSLQDYCRNCFFYIHQNPMEAALVKALTEWKYSSYRDYAGLRKGTLCNKELAVKYCGYESEGFIKSSNEFIEEEIKNRFRL